MKSLAAIRCALIVVLILTIGLVPAALADEAPPTSSASQAAQALNTPALEAPASTCVGGEDVLLLQDVNPWGYTAIEMELTAQGKSYCIAGSADLGVIDLSQFGLIVIASGQTQTFYNALFPGGVVYSDVADYVDEGGCLLAGLADSASGPGSGGVWGTSAFVGGVTHVFYTTDNLSIADAAHPVVTGVYGGANGGQLLDVGYHADLDGWGSSSHGYFANLPGGATTILTEGNGQPTIVEYPYGSGTVLATLTTTEWMAGFGNPKLLANELGAICHAHRVPIDVIPNKTPNRVKLANPGLIQVAVLTTPDFDAATVDPTSVVFGPAGARPLKYALTDIDGDGDQDLVLLFSIAASGIQCGDTEAEITGALLDGTPIIGSDAIVTTGC